MRTARGMRAKAVSFSAGADMAVLIFFVLIPAHTGNHCRDRRLHHRDRGVPAHPGSIRRNLGPGHRHRPNGRRPNGRRLADKDVSAAEISRLLGVSRTTVYRYLGPGWKRRTKAEAHQPAAGVADAAGHDLTDQPARLDRGP